MVKSLPPDRSNKHAVFLFQAFNILIKRENRFLETGLQSLLGSSVNELNTHFSLFSSSRVTDFYRNQKDALLAAANKWLSGEWNIHPVL